MCKGSHRLKKNVFLMKSFHKRGVFILLFRNLKVQNGIFWARIECLDVSDNSVIGWFLASILLKIWILNDLRCFVAFWFCREIYGKKIWIRISQIQYGGGVTILWKFFIKFRYFLNDGFPKAQHMIRNACNKMTNPIDSYTENHFLSFIEISEQNGYLCGSHSGPLWLSLHYAALHCN